MPQAGIPSRLVGLGHSHGHSHGHGLGHAGHGHPLPPATHQVTPDLFIFPTMAIPNEALAKLLQEIEQKATFSQQQIGLVKAQITAKAREQRMLQLTTTEVDSLPKDTRVYEGVGKISRFVLTPTREVKQRLAKEGEEIKSDTANLEKKLHYLETTLKNSRDNFEQLLQAGSRS
ncbi:Prefoldin [Phyllosticta citriasiana]|uniref:Prefoldin n=1 Tax=Phyllosticta citriasiana TaxID=595635 RepID=UPI0030FDBA04